MTLFLFMLTTITKIMLSISKITHTIIDWRYSINEETVLNQGAPSPGSETDPAAALKQAIYTLKAQAINSDGSAVDYSSLTEGNAYTDYRIISRSLQRFDPSELKSDEEKLAFWINLYNALVIDAVITFGVKHSINEFPGFFWKAAYCINGYRFSTVDIEYGVIRNNIGHPGIPGPHFSDGDPRRKYNLKILDPRIHFALVCAARSCPPISFYTPAHLNQQLELATRSFINVGGVEIKRKNGEVMLSKIFQWYAPDFGGPAFGLGNMDPVLDYIAQYLDNEGDRKWITTSKPNVKFSPYDWALNTKVGL
jgi:hypothetical protein